MPKKRGMHSGNPGSVIETIQELFSFKTDPAHIKSGKWGEKLAVRFLKARKWSILGERVRSGKHDELDIVAEVNEALVFVEVKTRRSEAFGRPFSAVNIEKRKRLSRAAVNYLKENNIKPKYIRFDVVEVIGDPGSKSPEIRHIENAFPMDSNYRLWW